MTAIALIPLNLWRRSVALSVALLSFSLLLVTPASAITDSWVTLNGLPAASGAGAALVVVDSDRLYALRGGGTTDAYRYSRATNAWTAIRSMPAAVTAGGTLVNPGERGFHLYAAVGGSSAFYRYTTTLDTWRAMASAPGAFGDGASAAWSMDDTIYIHAGGGSAAFYRYDIRSNAWATISNDGFARGIGSALYWPGGDSVYSLVGNGTQRFHVYNRSTASWATAGLESAPVVPGAGAMLVGAGPDTLYFLAGGGDTRFFRYLVLENAWDTMEGLPVPATAGAAVATRWVGDTFLYALAGGGTSFSRYELEDSKLSDLGSFASSIALPPIVLVGDSVSVVVTDNDEDRTSAAGDEAVHVVVTNLRTGESEVLRLAEEGPVLTKKFGLLDTLPLTSNSLLQSSGDDRLFALAGDTIRIVYIDADQPFDTSGGFVYPVHANVAGTVVLVPNFAGLGDSLARVVVRDTDQNFQGTVSETVLVKARNNRTGETEAWVLAENAPNAGYFGLAADSLPLSTDPAWAATADGRLFALAGDTITVYYEDPTDPTDSAFSASIRALHETGSSSVISWNAAARIGDSGTAVIRDTDQNFNAFLAETVLVAWINMRTSEFETRVLTERETGSGYFGLETETMPFTGLSSFSASNNGRLYVLAGDSVRVRYIDPTGPSDSAFSALFYAYHESAAATCTFAGLGRIGDSLTAIVIDTDQNFSGLTVETVTVTVWNNRTGESETWSLREKSANAGYFGGGATDTLAVTMDVAFNASGNGRLHALAGDTLTIVYTDSTDPLDSVTSAPIAVYHDSVASVLTSPGNLRLGDSLTVIIRDTDQNLRGIAVETVAVEVRNNRTGETETLVLTENGANGGYFGGLDTLPLSSDTVVAASGSGILYVVTGDTLRILYTDPTQASDTASATITILPVPTAASFFILPASLKLFDSITLVLRDTDENVRGYAFDTVRVSARNMRTGEQETWTLVENAVNAGHFGTATDTMGVTTALSAGGSGNGRLQVLAGDTVVILYRDSDDPTDSLTSTALGVHHDSIASSFIVVPTWAVLGDTISAAVLRDTDQDLSGLVRDTVAVVIVHQRTGETETWTLMEDTPTSGHFGSATDSFRIRQDATQATSGNGILFALAGDTLRLLYTDPTDTTDTALTALITVRHDTTTAVFLSVPPSARIADSVTAIVRDTDQDFRGLVVETVSVVFTNERTGETETAVLGEVGAASGHFGGGAYPTDTIAITIDAAWNASGNGRLYALAGDTIRVRYSDPNHPADSLASGLFSTYHDSVVSAMTYHPASARLGDSLTVIIRDTDQNFSGLTVETVTVLLTNNRTGETERLVLRENGANGGYFGGNDTMSVDSNTAVSASGSGRLHALAGDTITILYTDPTDSTDTIASALIAAYHETVASAIVWVPATIRLSDSVGFALRDTDQNFFGTRVETVAVTVRNNRTGETETLRLTENGANGGHFGGNDTLPLSSILADNTANSGRLYVLVGDTLNVSYTDPSGGVDTLAATITVIPDPTPSVVHAQSPSAKIHDSVTVTIRDTDQNFSGTRLETVPVVFTNMRTGESETVTLNENGANGGYFGLSTDTLRLSMDTAWSASGNGRLFVLAGDTIVARYVDPDDALDSVSSAPMRAFHDSIASTTIFMPVIAAVYDSVSAVILDTDQNFQGLLIETVTVIVTNNRTGETETLTLTENAANAGYFGGNDTLPIVIDSTYFGSGNGRLYAVAADTLTIRYTDPTDSTDTKISPTFIGVYHETVPAAGTYPPSVRLGDSITAIIRDSDQNLRGLVVDTVIVSFTNTRTGEVETRVMSENGVNAGYFGGNETRAVIMDSAFGATGNGILYMLAGDTLLVTYVDPTLPSDSITSPPIQAYHDTVAAVLLFSSPSAKLYDSVILRLRDTDQNFFGTRTETVPWSVLNVRTGEVETFVLTEDGANGGYWGLPTDTAPVTMDATFAATGNGRVYALAGDTLLLRYFDPSGLSDSIVAPGITAFHDSVASAWTWYPAAVEIRDSFRVIVRDTDQNFQGLLVETVLVTFTVTRTGETETLVLREPNANAGYFGLNDTLPVTHDVAWMASGNGRLHVLAGDTVRAVYRDPTDTVDTILTPFIGIYHDSVPAFWIVPTVSRYDDSVFVYLRDTDQNFFGTEVETVWVTITNNRTGEVETRVLTESGANGGYFGHPSETMPITRLIADAPSGSGRLYALGGDTLTIRYVDPTDPTDSLTQVVDLVSWFPISEPMGRGDGLYLGAIAWNDYDRDGDPDLAVCGFDSGSRGRLLIIRNDGANVFTIVGEPMGAGRGVYHASLDWGDYDRDGDADLVVMGNDQGVRRLIVYRNDGGSVFTAAGEPMGANQGLDAGGVQWGDYDNDGDLDLVASGIDNSLARRLILFRNDTGVFLPVIEPLDSGLGIATAGIGATSVRFGDFDGDGDLDLAVAGKDNLTFSSRLLVLRNDSGTRFPIVAQPMGAATTLEDASLDWGDYDGDGDLDLVAAGNEQFGANPRLVVLRNDGNASFTAVSQPVGAGTGWAFPSVRWFDLDNDGDLDLLASGREAGGTRRLRVFRNGGGGTFSAHTEFLGAGTGLDRGALAAADWDRDGDIDLAVLGHDSSAPRLVLLLDVVGYPVNVAPSAPAPVTVNGAVFGSDTITLSWTAPTGDTTPSAALSYNLRIGRTSQGVEILSADTRAGDTTFGVILGNVQNGETAFIHLRAAGTYTWSVQAVDGGQALSAWSAERTFVSLLSTCTAVFPPRLRENDSVTAIVIDTDQNLLAGVQETVPLLVTNVRTNEVERLVLRENGVNAVSFGGTDTLPLTIDAAWSGSYNGRLHALSGDTIALYYLDPDNARDSASSTIFLLQSDTTVSLGVYPPNLRVDDSVSAVIRDSDENRSGITIETLAITVRNNRTGETETLILTERGVNGGYFGGLDTLPLTGDSAVHAASGSGRLLVLAGDTVTILYRDPSDAADTLQSGAIPVIPDTRPAAIWWSPNWRIDDSVTAIVRDTDQNFRGLAVETVAAQVRNGRTGETERIVLTEVGANGGYFGGGAVFGETVPLTMDVSVAASGSGRLHALAGDTVFVEYTDPDDPSDSATTGPVPVHHDTSVSALTIGPVFLVRDSVSLIVRDTDQNRSGIRRETVAVVVTNQRTGETERLTLTENAANAGYFGGLDTLPVSMDFADRSSGSGRLYALAADSVVVVYVDPDDPIDSAATAAVRFQHDTTSAGATFPDRVRFDEIILALIRDTDRDLSGLRRDTIHVQFTNMRTGERETALYLETHESSGYFTAALGEGETVLLTLDGAWAADGNGRLFAAAGDTVRFFYQDPRQPSDSLTWIAGVRIPETTFVVADFPPSLRTGDSVGVLVRDSDQNLQGSLVETVAVQVVNPRTGERETLVLRERGLDSGIFGGADTLPLSGDQLQGDSFSGRLFVLSGDTVIITYVDPTDPRDSATSSPLVVYPDTTAGLVAWTPLVLRMADSVSIIVRDSDQNFRGLAVETVSVTVTRLRDGETETLVLTERGANGGYFGGLDTLPLTQDVTRAGSGDGRLHVLPGDIVRATYLDPTDRLDSVVSSWLTVVPETTAATVTVTIQPRVPDSFAVVVRDSDRNRNGLLIESVAVTVTLWRTGETEVLELAEASAHSGYFGVLQRLPTSLDPADSPSGSPRLHAWPGDTFTIRYQDPGDSQDSVTTAAITIIPDTTTAQVVVPSVLKAGDSLAVLLRDSDQNRAWWLRETASVTVVHGRTGETERLVLFENAGNSGHFGSGDTLPLSVNPADAAAGNGRLYALAGDTVVVVYRDAFDPRDTWQSSPLPISPPGTPSSGFFPTTLRPVDSVAGLLVDSDRNREGLAVETVTLTVTVARRNEVETLVLRENAANSGYFGLAGDSVPLTADAAWADSGNGRLFVLAGETLVVLYADPINAPDTASFLVTIVPETTASLLVTPPAIRVGDSVTAILRDSDRNRMGWVVETVAVTVRVARTGETERLVLTERGANAGYFGGADVVPCSTDAADAVSGNGRLHVLAGDSLVITYLDPGVPTDSAASSAIPVFVDSGNAVYVGASAVVAGESLLVAVFDRDQNLSAFTSDTVVVVVTNVRSGETETVVLTETAVNAGGFAGWLAVTRSAADAASGSGRMLVLIEDTLVVAYVDPTDPADSFRQGVAVRSSFSSRIQQVAIIPERIGADSYRLYIVPTGVNGETLPGLDGVPFHVTLLDSVSATGRIVETVVYALPDSGFLHYTRVDGARLWFAIRVLGESFYPIVQLVAAGETPPRIIAGQPDATGSRAQILIPGGYYPPGVFQVFVEPLADFGTETPSLGVLVERANVAAGHRGNRALLTSGVRPEHQVNIRRGATGAWLHALDTRVTVTLSYPDADRNGVVDGTTILETALLLCYLDENLGVWIPLVNAIADHDRNEISVLVDHLTIFSLIAEAAVGANASGVMVYPNPWRPNDGIDDNGREYVAGDFSTGILFENVPAGATIRVLTILGEVVMERMAGPGGKYQWDARNQRGQPIASGQYMVVVDAPNGTRRVEKLTVIR